MTLTTALWVLAFANALVLLYFVLRLGWITATKRQPQSWGWLVAGFLISAFGTGQAFGVLLLL